MEEAKARADQWAVSYVETSAKTRANVDKVGHTKTGLANITCDTFRDSSIKNDNPHAVSSPYDTFCAILKEIVDDLRVSK